MKKFFPSLLNNSKMIFCENAGGSQVPEQVIKSLNNHLIKTNFQPNGYSLSSKELDKNIKDVKDICKIIFNTKNSEDFIFGNSTSQLVYNLSNSLEKYFTQFENTEIVLNSFNHEACITPFERMAKKNNFKINWWDLDNNYNVNYHSLLDKININTKLVVLPHTSNITGNTIDLQYLSKQIKKISKDTLILVDGVAFMPHDIIDIQTYEIDFYLVSFYKFYGLRGSSVMYINDKLINSDIIENQNHYFLDNTEKSEKKLEIGGINYECITSILGVRDYFLDIALMLNKEVQFNRELFTSVMSKFKKYENDMIYTFNEKIKKIKDIEVIECNHTKKTPIFSLLFKNYHHNNISLILNELEIICRNGTFYCDRLFDKFNLDKNEGVLRLSFFHYNTLEEVNRVIDYIKIFQKKKLLFDFSEYNLNDGVINFDNVKKSFNNLKDDLYYHNARKRAFSLLKINSNTKIDIIGDLNFYQSNTYNGYNGNILRKYPNISHDLLSDKAFYNLVYTFMNNVNENYRKSNLNRFDEYLQVHQIRVYANSENTNLIPEGIHQDGFNMIAIACIKRDNINGAINNIYVEKNNLVYSKQLDEGKMILINDNKLFHEVTNMKLSDKSKEGYRDIFVFTTIA